MTPYVVLIVLALIVLLCRHRAAVVSWLYRRKRKLPGGPDDGKGCLTAYERVMFAALKADFDRETS